MFILTSEFGGICSFVNLNCTDFARFSFHHIKSAVYEHFSSVSDLCLSFFACLLFVSLCSCGEINVHIYNSPVSNMCSNLRLNRNTLTIEWFAVAFKVTQGYRNKMVMLVQYTGWAKLSDTTLHFCL